MAGYGQVPKPSREEHRGVLTSKIFETNRPVKFHYRIRRLYKETPADPVGLFVVMAEPGKSDGEAHIRRPLIMDWGCRKGQWQAALSQQYGGMRQGTLTNQLRLDRHDAIITMRKDRPFQIVLLRVPMDKTLNAFAVRHKVARKEFDKYFSAKPTFNISTPEKKISAYSMVPSTFEELDEVLCSMPPKKNGACFTLDDLLSLCGARGLPTNQHRTYGSYDVNIAIFENEPESKKFFIEIEGPFIGGFDRLINFTDTKIEVYNEFLELEEDAPDGLGTRLLYSQALAAELVLDKSTEVTISCFAAGNYADSQTVSGFGGYYVWARLGYTTKLSEVIQWFAAMAPEFRPLYNKPDEIYQKLIQDGYLPEDIYADTPIEEVTMHDLMMTDKGRNFWRSYGNGWDAYFNLTPNSDGTPNLCMQVLTEYVREKEKIRGPMDKWASEIYQKVVELKLTHEDEKILDRIWDRLLIRRLLKNR